MIHRINRCARQDQPEAKNQGAAERKEITKDFGQIDSDRPLIPADSGTADREQISIPSVSGIAGDVF